MSWDEKKTHKNLHRLALQQTSGQRTDGDDEDMMGEHGFDLSLLAKPSKPKDPKNSSMMGLSYASDISALSGDDPFKSDDEGGWKDESWVSESEFENGEEDEGFNETMALLHRTMEDLKELSLDEISVTSRSAIGSAVENIKSSIAANDAENGRLGGINIELETIRSHLFTENKDEQVKGSERTKDDSKAMMWETILCRVRAGIALSLYSLAAITWQDMGRAAQFGVKFAGVLVLCFLASVPQRKDKEATANGFKIHVVLWSRKAALLFIYIVTWITLFDAAMESWAEHGRPVVSSHDGEMGAMSVGSSRNSRVGKESKSMRAAEVHDLSVAGELGTDPIDIVSILAEGVEKPLVPEIVSESVPQQDIEPIDILAVLRGNREKGNRDVELTDGKDQLKPTDVMKVTQKNTRDTKEKRKSVKKSNSSTLPVPGTPLGTPVAPLAQVKKDSHYMNSASLKSLLVGDSSPSATTVIKKSEMPVENQSKNFLDRFRQWVQKSLRQWVAFLVGSDGKHKSQYMLDILGEIWTHRKWN